MRIVVVGAGLAGLVAARELAAGSHEVLVLDKGRSVGGRLATRRIGAARLDHGAQFFTVRGDAFRAQADDWLERDVARVWCHGFHGRTDGYPRYVGTEGMNSLAKDVARGLDVRCSALVFTLRRDASGWSVITDDAHIERADAVVLTCPIPQSWALLMESGVAPPDRAARPRVRAHDRAARRARPAVGGARAGRRPVRRDTTSQRRSRSWPITGCAA
jgi:renalase